MDSSVIKLILVTHCHQNFDEYLDFISMAVQGGVTMVQLRDKISPNAQLVRNALALQALLARLHIPFIINDHVELAAQINADGVHVGQSDLLPQQAREWLGPDKIIGYSLDSMDDLTRANQWDCIDYVAASAVFPSQTKTDCKTIWGLEGLNALAQQSRHPIVAIGGIDCTNAGEVIKHGAQGIAVVSALHDALNPTQAAQALFQVIQQGGSND